MTMQSDLRECLLSVVSDGVFFNVLPLGAMPTEKSPTRTNWSAIVISADIATPDNTTCGASDTDDHRMQIDLYSASQGKILSLRKQVFTAIENKFPMAYRLNDFGDYDTDLKVYRRIIEYSIPAE